MQGGSYTAWGMRRHGVGPAFASGSVAKLLIRRENNGLVCLSSGGQRYMRMCCDPDVSANYRVFILQLVARHRRMDICQARASD